MNNETTSKWSFRKAIFTVVFLCILILSTGDLNAEIKGHAIWSELLAEFVLDGKVDYQGLKKKEDVLDRYLTFISENDPFILPRNDQLAFFINSYNAYTVKLILKNFENGKAPKSIKKIGGFFSGPWSIKFCNIGGKVYTLDNIEHDIIRPEFQDPRVHFAVNCASRSCPPLHNEAYGGENLDEQLDQVTSAFLNNGKDNYISQGDLHVSKIFSWFKEDFDGGVLSFFSKNAGQDLAEKIAGAKQDLKIVYLDYDWSLNGR